MSRPVHDLDVPADDLAFHRRSGRLSLDLVATIGERWGRRFERLRRPADVDRWLQVVRVPTDVSAGEDDLDAWRRLRGAVEDLAVAAMDGAAYPDGARALVNRVAARPDPPPRLEGDAAVRTPASQQAARAACARDAVRLFGGPRAGRVRECAADDCALVFVDASRPGNRRWCSMGACGNRHKVARHRRRSRQTT